MRGAKKGLLHTAGVNHTTNERVTALMDKYLPPNIVTSRDWRIAYVDGTKRESADDLLLKGMGGYDKVLVDAPSSHEGYIAQAMVGGDRGLVLEELRDWKPSSITQRAAVQLKLLMSALRAVRIGGRVVYTTNSISDEENDGVVANAISLNEEVAIDGASSWTAQLELLSDEVEQRLAADWAEQTTYGWMILPDHAGGGGWGPRYISILTKTCRT